MLQLKVFQNTGHTSETNIIIIINNYYKCIVSILYLCDVRYWCSDIQYLYNWKELWTCEWQHSRLFLDDLPHNKKTQREDREPACCQWNIYGRALNITPLRRRWDRFYLVLRLATASTHIVVFVQEKSNLPRVKFILPYLELSWLLRVSYCLRQL